MKTTTTTTC